MQLYKAFMIFVSMKQFGTRLCENTFKGTDKMWAFSFMAEQWHKDTNTID
jgi:hypothetical protein